jgi:hypothetical protein
MPRSSSLLIGLQKNVRSSARYEEETAHRVIRKSRAQQRTLQRGDSEP